MLCAHRLSCAPSQPNQRLKRTSSTLGVLRSTSSTPQARAPARWELRKGAGEGATPPRPDPRVERHVGPGGGVPITEPRPEGRACRVLDLGKGRRAGPTPPRVLD